MVQPRLGCGKSELFYGWPDSSQPLAVLHTEGNEKGNVNVEEANAIIDILRDVYDRKKVKGTSVGVIARYNGQKLSLMSRLRELSATDPAFRDWYNQLFIDTVDVFQGAERDFALTVVISFRSVARLELKKLVVNDDH